MMCNSEYWQHQTLHCDGMPVTLIYGSSVLPLQVHRNLLPFQVHRNQEDDLVIIVVL